MDFDADCMASGPCSEKEIRPEMDVSDIHPNGNGEHASDSVKKMNGSFLETSKLSVLALADTTVLAEDISDCDLEDDESPGIEDEDAERFQVREVPDAKRLSSSDPGKLKSDANTANLDGGDRGTRSCMKNEQTAKSSKGRRLGFATLTVREYPRVLGDNVCMIGAPISLAWEHDPENVQIYDLVEYDEAVKSTRRTQTELKMPSKHREKLLREMGYTGREIQEAVKKSNIARNHRKRTVEMLKMQPLHEAFEKLGRFGKKVSGRKKDDILNYKKSI
ncbi:unnamed protein product [Pseudo-nitzschia multistriata]|uniref:Uncharacterized protein n=1 Tax=Pseudo-nitzschia multistriata TaxID=183589 RepID=A0A448ZDS8_9STRA|nr:unnamed protein product [Pseudo-nitzschia multistriata]